MLCYVYSSPYENECIPERRKTLFHFLNVLTELSSEFPPQTPWSNLILAYSPAA